MENEAMTDTVSLEAMVRRLSRIAEDAFKKLGEVEMLWLIDVPGEGERLVVSPVSVPDNMRPADLKQHLSDAMRDMMEKLHATRYVHASECWLAVADAEHNNWVAEHGSLKDYPGREEAIALFAEDADQRLVAVRKITRPAHGKPYLSKLKIERADIRDGGRFWGLLPARPVIH
jgi:hypothetical protein